MTRDLFIITFIAALGGVLIGFHIAVIPDAFPYYKDYFRLTASGEIQGLAFTILGCIFGAFFTGKKIDKFESRDLMKIIALLFIASAVGSAFSRIYSVFLLFRMLAGVAIGCGSVLIPVYLAEITPSKLRGRNGMAFPLSVAAGFFLASFLEYLCRDSGVNNWRWLLLYSIFPSSLFLLLLFFTIRSPRWTMKKGYDRETSFVIRLLNPHADVDQVMQEMKGSFTTSSNKRGIRKSIDIRPYSGLLWIVTIFGVISQMTGINFIIGHLAGVLNTIGISSGAGNYQMSVIGAAVIAGIIIAMIFIDKTGRKSFLLFGTICTGIILALTGVLTIFGQTSPTLQIVLLSGFILIFSASQGSLIWVIIPEMLPNIIRARGVAIILSAYWLVNLLTYLVTPMITPLTGDGAILVFYSIVTFTGCIYIKKYLVETKNRSLEELEKDILKKYCPLPRN